MAEPTACEFVFHDKLTQFGVWPALDSTTTTTRRCTVQSRSRVSASLTDDAGICAADLHG